MSSIRSTTCLLLVVASLAVGCKGGGGGGAASRKDPLFLAARNNDAATIRALTQQGEPVKTVRDYIGERDEVAALVLGAAASGNPGALVANFCGYDSGRLPCPVMLIPGSLSDEQLERLS